MPQNFDRESCTQEYLFDQDLIKVIIGDLLFFMDDDHVSDPVSDIDGEVDTEACPTFTKEQTLRIFNMGMMGYMLQLSRTFIFTILSVSFQLLVPLFGWSTRYLIELVCK